MEDSDLLFLKGLGLLGLLTLLGVRGLLGVLQLSCTRGGLLGELVGLAAVDLPLLLLDAF